MSGATPCIARTVASATSSWIARIVSHPALLRSSGMLFLVPGHGSLTERRKSTRSESLLDLLERIRPHAMQRGEVFAAYAGELPDVAIAGGLQRPHSRRRQADLGDRGRHAVGFV